MSQGSLIKKLSRRKVPLERLTQEALETGQLEPGAKIEILVRRVTALEVTKATGQPPALLRAARERRPDEDQQAWRERWKQIVQDDPELIASNLAYSERLKEAIVTAGCVAPRVVASEADIPDGADADTITLGELGPDLDDVYEAIVAFSGLPYSLRAGGGEITTFPEQQDGDRDQPHGEVLRQDAERAAEPPAGGLES